MNPEKQVSPKATAGAVAAAVVTILVWVLSDFAAVDVPEGVQVAATTVIVFAAAYVKRDPKRDVS